MRSLAEQAKVQMKEVPDIARDEHPAFPRGLAEMLFVRSAVERGIPRRLGVDVRRAKRKDDAPLGGVAIQVEPGEHYEAWRFELCSSQSWSWSDSLARSSASIAGRLAW